MFELLSEPIRKYIRDKRWEYLRPIQAAAIKKILSSDEHVILASRTASGKTEAAFLPILSKVDFRQSGVKVIYISPLIALINDQFQRIEDLCSYLDVRVTKWHGEASRSLKEQLIKDPSGVLLITPESLEAMLANAPQNVRKLFGAVNYIVIDEIHSFLGADRGIQLKSILARLKPFNVGKALIIGLSATIGELNYGLVKSMTGDEANTKILLDKAAKEIEVNLRYYAAVGPDLPSDLLNNLYLETKDQKVLIFPNSRSRCEEVAVKLKKRSESVKGHPYYFSHHSSIHRELREYIETFAKTNVRYPFSIACTSTLELGIDIGSVDMVVQIDSVHSISSLVQRLGRSGRREGEKSKLLFYATNPWSLLQTLACLDLFGEGYIEPLRPAIKPYDILLHQVLAYVKQFSECDFAKLWSNIRTNHAFLDIEAHELKDIVNWLLKTEMLEQINGQLIIGVDGEYVVNSKDFYTVFKTEPAYKILHQERPIGEMPFSPQLEVNENILLAAKIWKIIDIDHKAAKISVVPASDGKKPVFSGSGGAVHSKIRERMLEVLFEKREPSGMVDDASEALRQLRRDFSGFTIECLEDDRPVLYKDNVVQLYAFQSTLVNRTLAFFFRKLNLDFAYEDSDTSFTFRELSQELPTIFKLSVGLLPDLRTHIADDLEANPSSIAFSKWGEYLPVKYQVELLINKYYDFENTLSFLKRVNLVRIN
ncbi:DEAD/DEAH box helicase [Dyadobacter luticola]|uniref:DEAD/DEAH box helicase n=1 Tax=Dyadobacter luticola TaxID=1979387 RepID=UPI00197A8B01|nr:DEAD/DEAH box helicase [Dyadobacter luticola]